jgi:hypothetical protein
VLLELQHRPQPPVRVDWAVLVQKLLQRLWCFQGKVSAVASAAAEPLSKRAGLEAEVMEEARRVIKVLVVAGARLLPWPVAMWSSLVVAVAVVPLTTFQQPVLAVLVVPLWQLARLVQVLAAPLVTMRREQLPVVVAEPRRVEV